MRNIYAIGETVFDIIFKDNEPVTAKSGGSVLNTCVSLGRLNLPVHLITEYANDPVGEIIDGFLNKNGVSTDFVQRFGDGKSALALAFLDENNDADYSFYKLYGKQRLNVPMPDFKPDDILLFGSFFAITKEVRYNLLRIVQQAKKDGALVMYDPNFRNAHSEAMDELRPMIIENIALADIIRGSNEDFQAIFDKNTPDETYQLIAGKCPNLIYTANTEGVYLRTDQTKKQYRTEQIEPVSTIGAGDNFNAGILFSLIKNNITREKLAGMSETVWDKTIKTGIAFATHVCLQMDNYISKEFADKQ